MSNPTRFGAIGGLACGPLALCALLMMSLSFAMVGCGADDAPSTSRRPCSSDSACDRGTVCLLSEGVCGAVSCDFCLPEQICYTSPAGEQSCSSRECSNNAQCTVEGEACVNGICQQATCASRTDCPDGQICNVLTGSCVAPPAQCGSNNDCPAGRVCLVASGICRAGCTNDTECDNGRICETEQQVCTDGCRDSTSCAAFQTCGADNQCACDSSKCPTGERCNGSGLCEMSTVTSCAEVNCPVGQYCDSTTLDCVAGCTADSCGAGQVCNMATGQCAQNQCPNRDPASCVGATPHLNPTFCECAQCIDDTHCGAGQRCNSNGQCTTQQCTPCAADMPGSCSGANNAPYCLNGCCSECVGAADCPGQVCIDGFCGTPPDCSVDPTVCPAGYECQAGACTAQAGGQPCDQNDPFSCPDLQSCNPATNQCEGLGGGGGFGCGLCNADCTCDGGLTCNGFFCDGCTAPQQCPGFDPGNFFHLLMCIGGTCLPF